MPILSAATSGLSLAKEHLAASFADATEFQAVRAVNNAADAREGIFVDSLPTSANGSTYTREELEGYRPFVLISRNPLQGFRYYTTGVLAWNGVGQMYAVVEYNVADLLGADETLQSVTPEELERRWDNSLGKILLDETTDAVSLASQAESAGRMAISEMEVQLSYRIAQEKIRTDGDHFFAQLLIKWGGER